MSRSLVSFRLADDLKQALKARADLEGISITELVNRLLRESLSKSEVGAPFELRLSDLEDTVKHLLKSLEFERRMREAVPPPEQLLKDRIDEMESRLQQMSGDLQREKLEFKREKFRNNDSQDAHQEKSSLEDIRRTIGSSE